MNEHPLATLAPQGDRAQALHEEIASAFKGVLHTEDTPLTRSAFAYYDPRTQNITRHPTAANNPWALAHEIGHSQAHQTGNFIEQAAHTPVVRNGAHLIGSLGGLLAGAVPKSTGGKVLAGLTTAAIGAAPNVIAERAAARRATELVDKTTASSDELRQNKLVQEVSVLGHDIAGTRYLLAPLLGAAVRHGYDRVKHANDYASSRRLTMPNYVANIISKIAAVHQTRRKMKVRGFYSDPSPGMFDLNGKFEDAAKSNAAQEKKMAFDTTEPPPEAAPVPAAPAAPSAPVDRTYELPGDTPLHGRFNKYLKILDQKGAFAGTGHRRVVIPKSKITEEDIGTLGFEPVVAAIPEAGQDRFQSWRHPDNNYHIHSHNDRWTIHQDRHPAMTMLSRKIGPVAAFTQGIPHVITEGVPGLGYYLIGRARGNASTADRVTSELDPTVKEEIDKVAALKTLETYGFHGVKRAAEQSKDPVAALVDIFRKSDFGFDENGRIKSKTKFRAKGAVGSGSEVEATTPMPLGGFW